MVPTRQLWSLFSNARTAVYAGLVLRYYAARITELLSGHNSFCSDCFCPDFTETHEPSSRRFAALTTLDVLILTSRVWETMKFSKVCPYTRVKWYMRSQKELHGVYVELVCTSAPRGSWSWCSTLYWVTKFRTILGFIFRNSSAPSFSSLLTYRVFFECRQLYSLPHKSFTIPPTFTQFCCYHYCGRWVDHVFFSVVFLWFWFTVCVLKIQLMTK